MGRYHDWLTENAEVVDLVMGRIREEGALGSSDFEAPADFEGGTWWNWKPAKRALDVLFTCGLLMVSERRNFQRRYDLPERVLPAGVDTREPSAEEVRRFRILGALRAHGLLAQVDMRRPVRVRAHLQGTLGCDGGGRRDRVRSNRGAGRHASLCPARGTAAAAESVADTDGYADAVHLLSPFDNLIIDRDRLARLFGFEFSIECYLPAAKRRYGYFNLPILWGDRFAGRLDPKADRQARVLRVRGLSMEPDFVGEDRIYPLLAERLWHYAAFNGCDEVALEAEDAPGAPALKAALAAAEGAADREVTS